MPEKRQAQDMAMVPVSKKSRGEMVIVGNRSRAVMEAAPARTSNMEAPIMLLSGHKAEIYTGKFHPTGNWLASAGMERLVYLWNVYGECENVSIMTGHSGPIIQLCFSEDGDTIYTASTDKTVGLFDTMTGQRIKRYKGHEGMVNSVAVARDDRGLIVSGADDCHIKVWDRRQRLPVHNLNNEYQVTAVTFTQDAQQVVSGGIDNDLKIWDLRKGCVDTYMKGHTDTVTGIALSPDGNHVLTNCMDQTARIWDVRPFCTGERCTKIFRGHAHNFEKNLLHCAWSPDGELISAGSSDRNVYVWNVQSRKLVYKLPGHLGAVNDVDFHSVEPIILSASSDKQIYLGEFEP